MWYNGIEVFHKNTKDPIETYFRKRRGMSMVYAHSGYM